MRGLSLVAASGGHSSSQCAGLSLSRPLWSTGSRRAGSVIVARGPSCSAACGIFPDQGSNPCPLHWQADSQPLCHQGSPLTPFLSTSFPSSTQQAFTGGYRSLGRQEQAKASHLGTVPELEGPSCQPQPYLLLTIHF